MFGPAALGVFNMSYEISNMPTTELVAPINRAVFPGYAKLKHDLQSMRAGYLKVVGIIALIALPAAAGIGVVAPLLVPVWLGDKWIKSIPLMQVLAFSGGLVYLVMAIFLWLISGKPPGAEHDLIERVWPIIRKQLPNGKV